MNFHLKATSTANGAPIVCVAARRPLHAQAGGALLPGPRHGNARAAARTFGGGRRTGRAPRIRIMTTDALPLPLSPTVEEAYAFCRRITHRYGANFSVGFRF